MHEAGMVRTVVDAVVAHAVKAGGRPVKVYLLAGDDIGTSDESLRFYWDEMTLGTVAEGASLEIEHTPTGGLRLAAMDVDRDDAGDDGRGGRESPGG